ncbi:putative DD41D transposase [Trichonephila clavipes]|uniref:Putative DD41D transposase n=1 Tax=Trichonephila clavipes TaxID=2585209 RepID=A0A8X6SJB0_TRICX|nr:putative DD41D transposase [Trichonephila clavipes]
MLQDLLPRPPSSHTTSVRDIEVSASFEYTQNSAALPVSFSNEVDATVKGALRTFVNGFKSVTRVQRRVRTEWNVDTPTSKSIHQWERTLKETGALVSQTGKNIERKNEDQISSSINHIKNLTLLTSSKYNELNGQVTLSEWTKTAPLKKVFNDQPIDTRKKGWPNLRWIDGQEKDLLLSRTKNWRTLAGRRLAWKRFLEKAKALPGLLSLSGKKEVLKQNRVLKNRVLFKVQASQDMGRGHPIGITTMTLQEYLLPLTKNNLALHFKYDQARRRFVEWAQNEIAVISDFHKQILFSDEAHFWLNGYANKQNCHIWSEANPQVFVETPLHQEKLTVWCALWAGEIIGPYFFKNDEGHNVTINGDRYRAMITNFFIPELNNHDVQELWFQQDGATCQTARATIDLLKDTFGDRLISSFGPVNWPPRSCDLTPLDYFLWGYVKSLVYADKPQTLDHLEDNIRRVIADIRPQMLEKVIENWTSRLDYIRPSRGSYMPEIIFKM